MTSPSGSIGIGVSVDAGDLDTQITKAVQAAMGDVLTQVRKGLDGVEGEFRGVDLSAFNTAVQAQAAKAGGDLSSTMANAGRQAGQAVSDPIRQAAQDATSALGRVDGSSLRGVGDQATRAGAGIDEMRRKLDSVDDAAKEAGDKGAEAGERVGSAFGSAVGKVGAAATSLAGIAGIADTIGEAIDRNSIGNKLRAQLDLTKDESAQAGKVAGDLFGQNYGESFGAASDAVGSVLSNNLANFADDGSAAVESVSKAALVLADTFDVDLASSTQTVQQLIRNGLVGDASEGFDLLAASFQRVPAAMRDELPDLINEYGTFFSSIGLNGQDAFGALVNASYDGQIAMDKVGDAVKEFGIRATDIGDTGAVEALDAIGLAGADVQNRLLAGGDTAKGAFDQVVAALLKVPDPAKQAASATALFGTPLEDLDKTKIPAFLSGLQSADTAMGDFQGTVDEMGSALSEGPGAALETFKRSVQTNLVETLGGTVSYFRENATQAKILGTAIAVLAGGYVAFRTAASIGAVIQGVSAAMTGATLATNASTTAVRAQVVAMGIQKVSMLAGAAATGIATAATWAFNAALAVLTSPITLVIAAIAAVVGALYLFFTKTEVGRQVFETLKNAVVVAWQAIQSAIGAVWAFLQPIFAVIVNIVGTVLVGAFNVLSSIVSTVWSVISGAISGVWNGIIQPIFSGIVGFVVNTLIPAFQRFAADVSEAWQMWSGLIANIWNNVVMPVFGAIRDFIMNVIVPAIMFLWQNVIVPAFTAIGDVISAIWTNVVSPVFGALRDFIMNVIVPAIMFLWQNVVQPAFDTIGSIISAVWENVIRPTFDAIKAGLSSVGDFFGSIVSGISGVWDSLRGILAKPINFMIGTVYNNGIRKAWNVIEKFIPGIDAAPELPLIPEHYTGGRISGRKGKDNVLMWGSDDEHMLTVSDVAKAGGHNIIYAIRDMIQRGVPFSWDNGALVQDLGRSNLEAYGAKVASKGIGNVNPEGLFDRLKPGGVSLPKFYKGGPVDEDQPWMQQLILGHEFARAQHGKPYQWAGPTGPGSSFDCSGFMGSIAAAILGQNPWQRYWATSSFAGYPSVGPQGFVKGLKDGGFVVGVTDDPGGPGGGHTAGVLGAVKAFSTARVESGGALGDVHYGTGTDPLSFAAVYGLPIGANGFFNPGTGGSGPSPAEQRSFLERKVSETFDNLLNPIKDGIAGAIGSPPPEWLGVPGKFLDHAKDTVVHGAFGLIGGLGDRIGEAWGKAQDIGRNILDFVNPFDSGGEARGTGFMPKNVISPERVLSPEQTRMFALLVKTLDSITRGGSALVERGDYDGRLRQLGIEEDSPLVDAVLQMRDATIGVGALIEKGDYDGRLRQFGIEEDNPLIDAALTVREAAVGLQTTVDTVATGVGALVTRGDYDGRLRQLGVEEDSPLVDAVLSVREAVLGGNELLGSAATAITSGADPVKVVSDAVLPVLDTIGSTLSTVVGDAVKAMTSPAVKRDEKVDGGAITSYLEKQEQDRVTAQGELLSDTETLTKRTESSQNAVSMAQFQMLADQVADVANRLTGGVLGPVVQDAMKAALGVVSDALGGATEEITAAQTDTTDAVNNLGGKLDESQKAPPPFGAPGSAFDAAKSISDAVVSVANTASQALLQLGQDIYKAALAQKKSTVDNPAGVLGDEKNSGGFLVDTIVRLTGVEIQIRDFIYGLGEEVRKFRGDQFQAFDESGALLSDTASLMERTASSTELVIAEQNRINRELIKALLRYIMVSVLLPILMALVTAIITVITTAIGALVGMMIGGPIGALIGAAAGALAGLALSAVAAAGIGALGLGAGAAIDSFDQGGVAVGTGFMPKNIIAPERTLSPRQTTSFERLVDILDGAGISTGDHSTRKSVHINQINVNGNDPAQRTADDLLELLS